MAPPDDETPNSHCDAFDAFRILHWIQTGIHIFEKDSEKRKRIHGVESFTIPSFGQEEDDEVVHDGDSETSSAPSTDRLVGCDDGLFIPTAKSINRTFYTAKST
jgi:hypothetical protein